MTRNSERPRTVYFIRPVGMKGPIKIGCSASPERRRSALDNWSPFALEVIAEIGGNLVLERRFHAFFRDHHERREWFKWSSKFDDVVAAINAGTFDVSSLPPPEFVCLVNGRKPLTPAQRLKLSYSLRISALVKRAGYYPPRYGLDITLPDDRALADAYLVAPHLHGRPIEAAWAKERQREWISKLPAEQVAA